MLIPLTAEERAIAAETQRRLTDAPFLFTTVTGTHQYGFTSPDSDIDVRGAYAMPTIDHLGLLPFRTHVELMDVIEAREVDGVAYDLGRYFELVLKGSGNLVEELFSPLVIYDGGRLEEIRAAVYGCLTKGIVRHYLGFFDSCIKKLERRKKPPEVKTALYALRIALTGTFLLETGRVEAHLPTLADHYQVRFCEEWIAMKISEHEPIPDARYQTMLRKLPSFRDRLRRATRRSVLPGEPTTLEALNEVLVSVRLEHLPSADTPCGSGPAA